MSNDTAWQRTTYTLALEQSAGAPVPEPDDMRRLLAGAFNAAQLTGYRSSHVTQGETFKSPSAEQEAMRKRVYAAFADSGPTSPGPLLFDFAETVLIEVDARADADELDESTASDIAAAAVPVYTHDRIALFTESIDLACWETESEVNTADGVSGVAAAVLYDLAYSIAERALGERRESDEEARETRAERADELREQSWDDAADEYEEGDLSLDDLAKRVSDSPETLALVNGWLAEDAGHVGPRYVVRMTRLGRSAVFDTWHEDWHDRDSYSPDGARSEDEADATAKAAKLNAETGK